MIVTPNTSTGIVPCLPCCNRVYQDCGCPQNPRLNEIGSGGWDKSIPRKYVTFFIHGLFAADGPSFSSLTRMDGILNDGVGAATTGCSADQDGNSVWTFAFASLPLGRTLVAYVRFIAATKTFEAKIIVDGVDPGWAAVTKTFSNEFMATVAGNSGGYGFISHSFCLCSAQIQSWTWYSPCLTDAEIGEKTLFATFSGLPACLETTYEINKKRTFVDPTPNPAGNEFPLLDATELALWRLDEPVAGFCTGSVSPFWDYTATMAFKSRANYPNCQGYGLVIGQFLWGNEPYTGYVGYPNNLDAVGNREALTFIYKGPAPPAAGTQSPWDLNNMNLAAQQPSYGVLDFPDTSRAIFIDFEPVFMSYFAVGNNSMDNNYGDLSNPMGLPNNRDLIHVTITE